MHLHRFFASSKFSGLLTKTLPWWMLDLAKLLDRCIPLFSCLSITSNKDSLLELCSSSTVGLHRIWDPENDQVPSSSHEIWLKINYYPRHKYIPYTFHLLLLPRIRFKFFWAGKIAGDVSDVPKCFFFVTLASNQRWNFETIKNRNTVRRRIVIIVDKSRIGHTLNPRTLKIKLLKNYITFFRYLRMIPFAVETFRSQLVFWVVAGECTGWAIFITADLNICKRIDYI